LTQKDKPKREQDSVRGHVETWYSPSWRRCTCGLQSPDQPFMMVNSTAEATVLPRFRRVNHLTSQRSRLSLPCKLNRENGRCGALSELYFSAGAGSMRKSAERGVAAYE